jgi:hypothetical protein
MVGPRDEIILFHIGHGLLLLMVGPRDEIILFHIGHGVLLLVSSNFS